MYNLVLEAMSFRDYNWIAFEISRRPTSIKRDISVAVQRYKLHLNAETY